MKQIGPLFVVISVLAIIFLIIPIVAAVPLAFSSGRSLLFPPPGYSLQWFENFFGRADFISGLKISLFSAISSTLLVTIIGGAAAYGIVRMQGRKKLLVDLFLNIPLLIPVLVIGIAMLFFLSRIRIAGSMTGLILGHTMLSLPLIIRLMIAAFENYNPYLEEAAANLGAPPITVFREIILPQARAGLGGGAALAFIISMSDATMGIFLRGPGVTPLPATLLSYMSTRIDPIIGASSVVFIGISVIFLLIINRLIGFESVIGIRRK